MVKSHKNVPDYKRACNGGPEQNENKIELIQGLLWFNRSNDEN
jgi:hypothetical protein